MRDKAGDEVRASGTPQHGIAVVERRTGVSQHVLRAWERRYGVITPARDSGGQRLYSEDDIERLRLVRAVADGGRRVSQVIGMPFDELRRLAQADAREAVTGQRVSATEAGRDSAEHLKACLDAVREMQPAATFNVLMRAAVALGPRRFIEGVAIPLLQIVGDGWEAGLLRPANEHSMSYALRRVLTWVLDALPASADAPTVIFGTLPEQRHEFGALFAAIIAASRHWNVAYLGGDLPVEDIAYASSVANADVVALSVIGVIPTDQLHEEIRELRAKLPAGIALVVGGHTAVTHSGSLRNAGAVVLPDLESWERWLDARASAISAKKPPSVKVETAVARWR
ncbi:MAG: MerR family transcriptional regulator [Gemmatimonadota bacterium]|nr:MerR family transcriptional regulator [Gemmatimonadota bacterium]